jgi:GNAT superfamily N-acetyltransferase
MSAARNDRIAVRRATPVDVPQLCAMMSMLAAELGTSAELHAAESDWQHNGFGTAPKFSAFVAERETQAIGMATYSPLYIPDVGKESLFVHHLYVEETWRRRGIATALLAKIAAQAVAQDRPALELGGILTTPRRRFFEATGFHIVAGYATYILFGDALTSLATLALDVVG